jgi:sigma-54 dependent transcriptional regulator, acetoin dehydrogenase operon transcriptional activator AcoR
VYGTPSDLEALAAQDEFRADLLARLSGFIATLPPLRERLEDLGLLLASMLLKAGHPGEPAMTPEAARVLFACPWPGNVRELQKCISSALVLAKGEPVDQDHLPAAVRSSEMPKRPESQVFSGDERLRRDELVARLREHGGNVTAVARANGQGAHAGAALDAALRSRSALLPPVK